jgi:hypothetical protein
MLASRPIGRPRGEHRGLTVRIAPARKESAPAGKLGEVGLARLQVSARLALALVIEPPTGAGPYKAQAPRLPSGRHRAVRAAIGVHLEWDAFFVAARHGCRDSLGASNRPVVQQLWVAAPTPGIGHGEFGREGAVGGVGGAQIGASNSLGRRASRRGRIAGRLSSGRTRRKEADDACHRQRAHDSGDRPGHDMNLLGLKQPLPRSSSC